ncbi:MAG: DUF3667 domain-containing protein [Flavobacteriaceae bacterium]
MDPEFSYCKNCGEETINAYCHHCGQRSSVYKVTFRETFQDLADNLLSISAPIIITLKMLVLHPGSLFRDYLSGKRKKYYKPISFFILTTVFYLFIRWAIDFDFYGNITVPVNDTQAGSDLFVQAGDYFFQNIKSLAFILVFTLAVSMKIFFRKEYTLVEFIAVSFYLNGIYSLLATINLLYIQYINVNIRYLAILAMWIYFIWSMILFFPKKSLRTGLKSLVAYPLAYVFYAMVAYGLSFLIVLIRES